MNQALVKIILRELLRRVHYHEQREPDDYKHCPTGVDLGNLIALLEAETERTGNAGVIINGQVIRFEASSVGNVAENFCFYLPNGVISAAFKREELSGWWLNTPGAL